MVEIKHKKREEIIILPSEQFLEYLRKITVRINHLLESLISHGISGHIYKHNEEELNEICIHSLHLLDYTAHEKYDISKQFRETYDLVWAALHDYKMLIETPTHMRLSASTIRSYVRKLKEVKQKIEHILKQLVAIEQDEEELHQILKEMRKMGV